ncbi:PilC/PilY family type IV pilus protein [Xanthomonas sp. WHRI 6106]|uniref:pilus assembly protein n=1 Tax=Xanthomonas sp. WHRI 6106 TaxID=3161566 RepID=UPI0032E86FCE
MPSRKIKIAIASGAALVGGLGAIYMLVAAQGQGVLAQAPLNSKLSIPSAFIMAVDDSGSMTFQTQFPGADGQGCWSTNRESFFSSPGVLNTTGQCGYNHVTIGPRLDITRRGVPPLDIYGFARSSAYNPTYFNPEVEYDPWIGKNRSIYSEASTSATKIDPRSDATVDLTANSLLTDWQDSSWMQNGMVIPKGVLYRRVNVNNRNQVTGYGNVQSSDGAEWSSGQAYVVMSTIRSVFFTPYTRNTDPLPVLPGYPNAYANVPRVRVANACGQGCDLWKYTIPPTGAADALQNFANWFSFYGNRNKAIIAGMTRSLNSVEPNLRVGYFRINQNASYDSVTDSLPMRSLSDDAQREALYNEMIGLTASGGTPNREAVNAAGIQFKRTDSGAPIQLACQKNSIMLFTDGYNNNPDGSAGASNDEGDGLMGVPFKDGNSNTMGDIAAKYYNDINGKSPLRPDLPGGLVPVPSACASAPSVRLDCQKNLHINFYGVTLGARGNLFDPDRVKDAYTDPSVYDNWPARSDNDPATVDDIWHAAVNTRGEYINARTPADITAAIDRVLASVTSGPSPSGTFAQSGARIGNGSFAVSPSYEVGADGVDWYGKLVGSTVSVNPQSRLATTTQVWEASSRIPAAASRNIIVSEAGAANVFNASNVSLADLCTKPAGLYPGITKCSELRLTALGASAQTAVAYLRGDPVGEVKRGGKFRDRTTLLGDIVNSTPVISAPTDDFGYRSLSGALGTSYEAYLNAKKAAGRYTVYVGANDGMLHAFDAGMTADGSMDGNGGLERFAYIPATALGHMGDLLLPSDPTGKSVEYQHRYYVDGPVVVGDVNYGSSWKTVAVGTAGAGGRSIFALDVTNSSSFSASSRLWEISDLDTSLSTTVRNNIGHVLGKPVIVPVRAANGGVTWKAIFGNGYNSQSGKAVLFLVDIKAGAPTVTMIEANEAGGGSAGSNGLGNIVVVDRWGGTSLTEGVRDGYADTVYGADQKGAIWKFDLRSSATSITAPLFTARTSTESGQTYRQPITGGLVATAGDAGGVMLFFGTGSFSFENDPKDEAIQSLYGINDTSRAGPVVPLTRANLQGSSVAAATQGGDRILTRGAAPANSQGWYVDLPSKERMVGNPSIASGIVLMPTYTPVLVSSGCSPEGSNWLFGLDTRTGDGALIDARKGSPGGARFSAGTAATSLSTGGTAPVKDVGVSAIPRLSPAESGSVPGGQACWMVVNAAGSAPLYVPYPCGRQSWRQVQ